MSTVLRDLIQELNIESEAIGNWMNTFITKDGLTDGQKKIAQDMEPLVDAMFETIGETTKEYVLKVVKLLLTTMSKTHRVKIAEPTEFDGSSKIRYTEWKKKLGLWMDYNRHGIEDDRDKITIAISYLGGPPAQYVTGYIDKLSKGENLGSWKEFIGDLDRVYGQKNEERSAKKEWDELVANEEYAQKSFLT